MGTTESNICSSSVDKT